MWLHYFPVRLFVVVVIGVLCSQAVSTQRTSPCHHNPSTRFQRPHLNVAAPFSSFGTKAPKFVHLRNGNANGAIDDADERGFLFLAPGEGGNVLAAQEIAFKRPLMNSIEDEPDGWRKIENSATRPPQQRQPDDAQVVPTNTIYNYRTTNRADSAEDTSFPLWWSSANERGGNDDQPHKRNEVLSDNMNDDVDVETFDTNSAEVNWQDVRKQKRKGVQGQRAKSQLRYFSGDGDSGFHEPHYAYAFGNAAGYRADDDDAMVPRSLWHRTSTRNYKRETSSGIEQMQRRPTKYMPSISTGVMTHLGNFFNDLTRNFHYNEKTDMAQSTMHLLHGADPLQQRSDSDHHNAAASEGGDKTANFLHAVRNYVPSHKVRTLVAMNPRGYHGSQFIDPNYMWVGLG